MSINKPHQLCPSQVLGRLSVHPVTSSTCVTSVRTWPHVLQVHRIFICLALSCCSFSQADAQLFGQRSVGNPINSPSNRAGSNSNSPASVGPGVGMLDGSERFVRGNRSRRDFVGSDRNEQSGFVGAGQAIGVGRVPSATEGLRIETSNALRLNRPLPPQAKKGIYYPRLELGFDAPDTLVSRDGDVADQRLRARIASVAGDGLSIDIAGRTATLTGSVESHRASELVEQLLSFEPGIDRIQNQLQVPR